MVSHCKFAVLVTKCPVFLFDHKILEVLQQKIYPLSRYIFCVIVANLPPKKKQWTKNVQRR